jgi:hypothetical protein
MKGTHQRRRTGISSPSPSRSCNPAALRAAGLLEVAEHLADGPRDVPELAGLTGTNGPYLRRLLRFLSSHGTFREDEDGRFHLTPQAALPRADAPGPCGQGYSW